MVRPVNKRPQTAEHTKANPHNKIQPALKKQVTAIKSSQTRKIQAYAIKYNQTQKTSGSAIKSRQTRKAKTYAIKTQQNTKASTKMQSSAKIASTHIKKATVRRSQCDKRIQAATGCRDTIKQNGLPQSKSNKGKAPRTISKIDSSILRLKRNIA